MRFLTKKWPAYIARAKIPCVKLIGAAVLGIVIFSQTDAVAATDQECRATKKIPQIVLSQDRARTQLILDKSSNQITAFAKKVHAYKPIRGNKLLGLAYTQMRTGVGVEVTGYKGARRICVSLGKVVFNFKTITSNIFVARRFKPGTCAYRAVLAHEQKHMKITQKIQAAYTRKIIKKLTMRANLIQPFYASNLERASKSLINQLTSAIQPLVKGFEAARAQENAKIDTPKSYRKTRSECARW